MPGFFIYWWGFVPQIVRRSKKMHAAFNGYACTDFLTWHTSGKRAFNFPSRSLSLRNDAQKRLGWQRLLFFSPWWSDFFTLSGSCHHSTACQLHHEDREHQQPFCLKRISLLTTQIELPCAREESDHQKLETRCSSKNTFLVEIVFFAYLGHKAHHDSPTWIFSTTIMYCHLKRSLWFIKMGLHQVCSQAGASWTVPPPAPKSAPLPDRPWQVFLLPQSASQTLRSWLRKEEDLLRLGGGCSH